jgi:hypothetical protein
MADDHVQAIIDLTVVAIGVVAVVYILKTPSLRRGAWRALRYGLLSAAPSLLWQETTRAWAESAHN